MKWDLKIDPGGSTTCTEWNRSGLSNYLKWNLRVVRVRKQNRKRYTDMITINGCNLTKFEQRKELQLKSCSLESFYNYKFKFRKQKKYNKSSWISLTSTDIHWRNIEGPMLALYFSVIESGLPSPYLDNVWLNCRSFRLNPGNMGKPASSEANSLVSNTHVRDMSGNSPSWKLGLVFVVFCIFPGCVGLTMEMQNNCDEGIY